MQIDLDFADGHVFNVGGTGNFPCEAGHVVQRLQGEVVVDGTEGFRKRNGRPMPSLA